MKSDLMGRQEAIESIYIEFGRHSVCDESGEYKANEIKQVIDWLPSSSLEIIYCRECINRPECPWTRTEEDYCSRAQKRRDNE